MNQPGPTDHHRGTRSVPLIAAAAVLLASACTGSGPDTPPPADAGVPTAAQATEFVTAAEAELERLVIASERAAWVQANFITFDTDLIAAEAAEALTAATVRRAGEAVPFDALELDPALRRKLNALKLGLTLPAPPDPAKTKELARIASELNGMFGRGQYCRADGECLSLSDIILTMTHERDAELLRELWVGWRQVAPPMKDAYARLVAIANEGAQGLGYADVGALWRSNYDMPPDAFAAELDRLWGQVQPLYDALHCHVRARLSEHYGADVVPPETPIPAHLLGNVWAQQWANIYELVAPADADPGYDLTARLEASGMNEIDIVRVAEAFFTSLGFDPLPETFWKRSLFVKPRDRDVVCHASAWDIDQKDDLRIKMCIQKTAEDFTVVHHELGHNFYQRAYNQQPLLFRNSANDGFHEAIGDTVALSVTPGYLKTIGLLDEVPDASKDIGLLLSRALDKVAFLPFGLLIDRWRWQVFSGQTPPERYNADWWELRTRYQGIAPPVARSEADFDPGAKYHIPGNTPYSRYFLAHILQFQFHRALCDIAGFEGPLHRCSIYGNAEAGRRLREMLAMGSSRPWPDALEVLTGARQMDATAILDYFAPLKAWLDEQNEGRVCGWRA